MINRVDTIVVFFSFFFILTLWHGSFMRGMHQLYEYRNDFGLNRKREKESTHASEEKRDGKKRANERVREEVSLCVCVCACVCV